MKFCNCGSLIIDGTCSNKACPGKDAEMSEWIIDGVLWRFTRSLTLSEAKEAVEKRDNRIITWKKPENSQMKPYTG